MGINAFLIIHTKSTSFLLVAALYINMWNWREHWWLFPYNDWDCIHTCTISLRTRTNIAIMKCFSCRHWKAVHRQNRRMWISREIHVNFTWTWREKIHVNFTVTAQFTWKCSCEIHVFTCGNFACASPL